MKLKRMLVALIGVSLLAGNLWTAGALAAEARGRRTYVSQGTEEDAAAPAEVSGTVPDRDGALAPSGNKTERSYPVLSENILKVQSLDVEAFSYSATASLTAHIYEDEYRDLAIIYSSKESADFWPGAWYVAEDDLEASDYQYTKAENYKKQKNSKYDGLIGIYSIEVSDANEADPVLSPDTVYTYRVVSRKSRWDPVNLEIEYDYYFVTAPATFTTAQAITKSNVSIDEVSYEDYGCYTGMVNVTVANPDRDVIRKVQIVEKDNNENVVCDLSASKKDYYSDSTVKRYFRGRYFRNDKALELRVGAHTGNGELTWIKQDFKPLLHEESELEISLSSNAESMHIGAEVSVEPEFFADDGMTLGLYYREKGSEEEWQKDTAELYTYEYDYGNIGVFYDPGDTFEIFNITELKPETEYEYYVELFSKSRPGNNVIKSLGTKEDPKTFTTGKNTTYKRSDFKDPGLYGLLSTWCDYNFGDDAVTRARLETFSSLEIDDLSEEDVVVKLDDFPEKLPNLKSLMMSRQDFSDIAPLKELEHLRMVTLPYAYVKELPDLSDVNWKFLSLSQNPLSLSEVQKADLPDTVAFYWTPIKQSLKSASTYYVDDNGKYPIILEYVPGVYYSDGRSYKASVKIGNTTKVYESVDYSEGTSMYIIDTAKEDFGLTTGQDYTAKIAIMDSRNDHVVYEEEKTFGFAQKPESFAREVYTLPGYTDPCMLESSYDSYVYIPSQNAGTAESVSVVKDGKTYFSSTSDLLSSANYALYLYRDLFGDDNDISGYLDYEYCSVPYPEGVKLPVAGDYDMVVKPKSGNAVTVPDVLHVVAGPLTTGAYACSYEDEPYDQRGDYVYAYICGYNLDSSIKPFLADRRGDVYAEFVSMEQTGCNDYGMMTCVCKMKRKKDAFKWFGKMTSDEDGYDLSINFDKNSGVIRAPGEYYVSKSSFFNDYESEDELRLQPIMSYYNRKKGSFELTFDSTVPADKELTVTICTDREGGEVLAEGTAKTDEKRHISLVPVTGEGEKYIPEMDTEPYIRVSDGQYGYTGRLNEYDWYNYHNDDPGAFITGFTPDKSIAPAPMAAFGLTVTAVPGKYRNSSLKARISDTEEEKSLTCTEGETEDIFTTGAWTLKSPLSAGMYHVELYGTVGGSERKLRSELLYVVPNDGFYSRCSARIDSFDHTKAILTADLGMFGIPDTDSLSVLNGFIQEKKLSVQVFNNERKEAGGITVTPVRAEHGIMTWTISGLEEEEIEYTVRVTADSATPLSPATGAEIYKDPLHGSSLLREMYYEMVEDVEQPAFCGAYTDDLTNENPLTLNFYELSDLSSPVKSITPERSEFRDGYYYLKKSDVKGLDPDTVYRCVVLAKERIAGSWRTRASHWDGYFCSSVQTDEPDDPVDPETVHPESVSLTPSQAKLKVGETIQLTAAVYPGNAENKDVTWESGAETVATVSDTGLVSAVSAGTALITVKTVDGEKKAYCEVNVERKESLYAEFTEGDTFEYTGAIIKPAVAVYRDGRELVCGLDYTLQYANNINAGQDASVTVKGKTFPGSLTNVFSITKKDIADEDVAGSDVITVQSGKKAAVELFYNGKKLSSKKDFENNDETKTFSSDGQITVTGKGNFTGKRTIDVKIAQVKPEKFKVTEFNPIKRTYNGEEQLLGTDEYQTNGECILAYSGDTVNAGTVKVTFIGVGDHPGSVTKSYKIGPASSAKPVMTLSSSVMFKAGGVRPAPEVRIGTTLLTPGKDYNLTYKNNTGVGTGKVIVKYIGNYKGVKSESREFTITKASLNAGNSTLICRDTVYVKKGKYNTDVYVDVDHVALSGKDYKVTYAIGSRDITKASVDETMLTGDNTEVSVTVKLKGNYEGTLTGKYLISKADETKSLSKSKVKITDKAGTNVAKFPFTGAPVEITGDHILKVTLDNKVLDPSCYTVSYSNNLEKGKAAVIINAKPGSGYYGSKVVKFGIVKGKIRW